MIKPEELCELRGSCTVLWEREGEIPLRDPISGQALTTLYNINFDSMTIKNNTASVRQKEIVSQYLQELDKHLTDLKNGKAEKTFEIKDLAELLFVSPKHLSNTIQEVLGKSPCDIYEERLMVISKELLLTTNNTISHIAQTLTFDPSNFTKFFKSYEGKTPKQFRELNSRTELHTK